MISSAARKPVTDAKISWRDAYDMQMRAARPLRYAAE